MNDEDALYALFGRHIASLPGTQRPASPVQKHRMFNRWENNLKAELADWETELANLESQPIDKQAIFNSARNKVLHLLHREARAAGLLPEDDNAEDDNGRSNEDEETSLPEDSKAERNKGRKGFNGLSDYLIPVIRLMRKGKSHKEAFYSVAKELGVRYNTVSAQCWRALGLKKTQQFVDHVRSGQIVEIIKDKYPQEIELIKRELEPLYR